jgi:hypothetical protein
MLLPGRTIHVREGLEFETEHRLAAQCHEVFRQTLTKKVSDLTVVESRAVKACETLGYYED